MNWSLCLSPEECHFAKIADLDALEKIALATDDPANIATVYERIFEAFDTRTNTSDETVLQWGQRYIAWASTFTERDSLPFLTTDWAKRMFTIATHQERIDLAIGVAKAILRSCAPLEKERHWWQKQHYHLTQQELARNTDRSKSE